MAGGRKLKKTSPFQFLNLKKEEMAAALDEKYPINISKNKKLIERVCEKYPLLPKQDVKLIIKTFFIMLRFMLVTGKVINIYNLFFNFKFQWYLVKIIKKDGYRPALKTNVSTPPEMKTYV